MHVTRVRPSDSILKKVHPQTLPRGAPSGPRRRSGAGFVRTVPPAVPTRPDGANFIRTGQHCPVRMDLADA
jgi:hypothetical protein